VVPEARVVWLLGVVAVEDGRVAGLLLTYVDCGRENGGVLDGINVRRTPHALLERWANQIGETVQQLHEGGVHWGNATADNVLVDKKYNAWLINVGVHHREGWVDEETTNTKEGDLEGEERIVGYLSNRMQNNGSAFGVPYKNINRDGGSSHSIPAPLRKFGRRGMP
jgi:hypothetical protein